MQDPINWPDVAAEVADAFLRYEHALVHNDVAALDALLFHSAHTVRYGATENLYGIDAIRAFRSARPSAGLARTLQHTTITTYGRDMAVASTEFTRSGSARTGRQQQTWVRMPQQGWCVVAAHVLLMEPAKETGHAA